MKNEIAVKDAHGGHVLRYWQLADGTYFGGTVNDAARDLMPFAYGPHVHLPLRSLLLLIADIARMDADVPYTLEGAASGHYAAVMIGRRMHADQIAAAVGCTEDEVRDYYRLVVEVPGDDNGG